MKEYPEAGEGKRQDFVTHVCLSDWCRAVK